MENDELRRAAGQFLFSLQQAGLTDLPKPKAKVNARRVGDRPPRPASDANPTTTDGKGVGEGDRIDDSGENLQESGPHQQQAALEVIAAEVAHCTRCTELAQSRTQTVFGVGNPAARLCFVGEAPGAEEDRQGEPFVGAAGKLLDKILAACQLTRRDVYILNTLKCRPPGNRNPNESEIDNCWGYARRQLEVINPEFICCLGGIAAQTVLQTKSSIGRLRQKFYPCGSSQVIVTYHPAYLLRNPNAKRLVWEDMKMLMSAMGVDVGA